ncbi:MAG TPA: YibE/F family protein [Acidimicrobiales bacterium]|nr:YibE/F family protein [Acidimicrobiales bacterium]
MQASPLQTTSAAQVRRILVLIAVGLGALTVLGLIVLWPRGSAPNLRPPGASVEYVDATVLTVNRSTCGSAESEAPQDCQSVTARVSSGRNKGDTASFQIPTSQFNAPTLKVGDKVVLIDNPTAAAEFRYSFSDFQRNTPLVVLFLLFAGVVIAFGRWQGVRALAGLVASLAVVLIFLLPSLLRGNAALPVALVASFLVAFLALYLAHGVNANTTVALLGTMASLVVIAALAALFVDLARLTGLSDEAAQLLRVTAEGVDPRGLIIAGTVVGALGVLDDVTVTQVSAVGELRRADPTLSRVALYRSAVRIGRDHVASTVNTLVLAYVGASLPLTLLFLEGGAPWGRVAAQEVVAVEIIRTLVGSIGLVLSVPFTTALAALAMADPNPEAEDDVGGEPPLPADWADFAPEPKPW